MKKLLLVLAVVALCFSVLCACAQDDVQNNEVEQNNAVDVEENNQAEENNDVEENTNLEDNINVEENTNVQENTNVEKAAVMTYAEYVAAELDSPVVIDAYVQGKQSWWDNKATVYTQDEDGAYFLYEMACSEEDYAKLEKGTHIKVTGYKAEWSGEVEIVDATFEIIDGNYIPAPFDATGLLGTDELIAHQNKLVTFKGMTVEAVSYKNDQPGDDIYVTLSKDGVTYDFCVEVYLTGTETDVYKAVGTLNAGDVVDLEGFLYWYEGPNTHITNIGLAA